MEQNEQQKEPISKRFKIKAYADSDTFGWSCVVYNVYGEKVSGCMHYHINKQAAMRCGRRIRHKFETCKVQE